MTTTPSRPIRLDALAYGGDYNPDQWPEEVWVEDARLMREAGVNLVSLPVFSWPRIEKTQGTYDFDWLDRVINLLWEHGIKVDLATATATPPAWLIREHPEILPHNVHGQRLEFGSRQAYCPSSPVFRSHALRLTEAMAVRYAEHPALALWHISNEYGDHVPRCWCPVSGAHFRRWLESRYGDIDGLNEAWGTSCWGQHYLSFDHIEPPRTSMGPINPSQLLDFERFGSDALLELFQSEIDVLRRVTPDIPVTTNFMSLFKELDYWDFAAVEDVVTDDAYPDPGDPLAHVPAALNYGLMRSLKSGQPWLLLEQAPSAVSWRDVNVPKAPGRMRLDSYQAIAHGSDGAMFFQWRQARFGPEKFHSAMLGHRGEKSRTFAETAALGAELKKIDAVRGSRVSARVALVVDWDSWWGSSANDSLPSQRLDWLEQARAWHGALFALGQTVDVVKAGGGFESPFARYDVVVVPNLYVVTQEQAEALTSFVEGGGHLVVGPFSGVVDPTEKIHPGGAPGPLRNLLGVEVDEWWPLADGDTGAITLAGSDHEIETWSEWIDVADSAEVVATYSTGVLDGRAAIVRNASGAGAAWYLSAALRENGLEAVLGQILDAASVDRRQHPNRLLEVVTRVGDDESFTFFLNHGADEILVQAPAAAVDLLCGADIPIGADIRLPGFGVAVLAHRTLDLTPTSL
ncbi:beta-galactosidase [Salinibacterium sp. G-O1]|uniref:beta-galactosidase n=1 Tax=Salinibacterium sp. G-O1 TaxID=3046208 RepID=UPI0024BA6AF0|nr:beta-galactosidase [Salinibacterium sp. G-O1]MDJ0333610.1 beta-galactosidase [Salinibacterium sp. G-O1]